MDYKKAKKILKKHDRQILEETPDCNGVSIKHEAGKWRMRVYVEKLHDKNRKVADYVFDEKSKKLKTPDIDGSPDELSVEVVEVGEIRAFVDRTAKYRPAMGGISIGHKDITAGTLGCVGYKSNGDKYILSNNHVLANSNSGIVGDDIYQPGPYDGGTVSDKIGTLAEYITLVFDNPGSPNLVDAALCDPTVEADVEESIIGLAYPYESIAAEVGMEVIKSGRTTAITEGTINEFSGLMKVNYGSPGVAYFDDQIITGDMSRGGDSGSLLIDKATGNAVGLLFAGSIYITLYNRMTQVESDLNITLKRIISTTTQVTASISPSVSAVTGSKKVGPCTFTLAPDPSVAATKISPKVTTAQCSMNLTVSAAGDGVTPTVVIAQASLDLSTFTTNMGYQVYGPSQAGGYNRIADDSLDRYELYRGIDAEPDLNGVPYETFSSLPHTTKGRFLSMRLFGCIDNVLDRKDFGPLQIPPFVLLEPHTYYFVLRKRNKWNLVSQNIESWSLKLDTDGSVIVAAPDAPINVSIKPAAGGAGLVEAQYLYDLDNQYPATHWLIYFTDNGVDPNPAVDSPTVVAMNKSSGIAHLKWTSPAADHNDTLKVLVRTRVVSGDNFDSTNTDIYSCTASTQGPSTPTGRALYGHAAEAM